LIYIIEDEAHAEVQTGEFSSLDAALAEIRRRAEVPWGSNPNRPPCTNWIDCSRRYEIVEYDTSQAQWSEMRRIPALEISGRGITWLTVVDHA
jgi:hypothetical protein